MNKMSRRWDTLSAGYMTPDQARRIYMESKKKGRKALPGKRAGYGTH